MEHTPYSQIEKGSFLIASPDVQSGFFFRGVILICEHNINGSFGVLVNRSLDVEMPEEVLNLQQNANPNVGIRASGPVQTNQMLLLHNSEKLEEQSLKVTEGVYLGGDLQFLQEAISDSNGPSLLLCFGYTGWGAGQLEREFLDGEWFLHQAKAEHLFQIKPEKLWQALLREMGGKYVTLSMIPEDLSLN
jgi:putative transcriptional regulator